MPTPLATNCLKSNLRRSVLFLGPASGTNPADSPRLVKRFHHPGLLQGMRDRGRARREARILAYLHALHLPVPTPRGVKRNARGWEVSMDWIPRTRPLSNLLSTSSPGLDAGLAGRLGRLMARLHAAGLDHGDLHPGNFLIDALGAPWVVDFHSAHLRRVLGEGTRLRDLIAFIAAVRESAAPRIRYRFLLAYCQEAHLWNAASEKRTTIEHIEEQAVHVRRMAVERRARRWLRQSSDCTVERLGEGVLHFTRAIERTESLRLLALPSSASPYVPSRDGQVFILRGEENDVVARWKNAVRLQLHAIPCGQPLALMSGPQSIAAFQITATPLEGLDTLSQRKSLDALLADRGLSLGQPTGDWSASTLTLPDGREVLVPPPSLLPRLPERAG